MLEKDRQGLKEALEAALAQAQAEGKLPAFPPPAFVLEVPKEKAHGDLATNLALVSAGAAKMGPRQVAAILQDYLRQQQAIQDLVGRIEIAGPGFINLFLREGWLARLFRAIETEGERYGHSRTDKPLRILLEYVSANPVGPMVVVNARAAAVGDCLANLYEAVGHRVDREYYVNDAGHQADLFAASLNARYLQLAGRDAPFPEDGYPGEYVKEIAAEFLHSHPELLNLPESERLSFFKIHGVDRMVELQQQELARFGVEFDKWFRERDLHRADAVVDALTYLRRQGALYDQAGAVWFASTRWGDDKDRVVIKSDGAYTYLAADIAYHRDKYQRGYERVIDIWGPDHHGYIGRMRAAVAALGYDPDSFEVIVLQLVTLLKNGQPVRMSKRAGEFVTLEELLDEVGKDAARFFFLMRSPSAHLDFDLDLAREQSEKNPVYYVQYAHARIASLFRQAEASGVARPRAAEVDADMLTAAEELDLARKLAEFPEEVRLASERQEPHRLTRYAMEVASLYHSFYAHHRVLGSDPGLQAARLYLSHATQVVLRNCLTLLGVSSPEKM